MTYVDTLALFILGLIKDTIFHLLTGIHKRDTKKDEVNQGSRTGIEIMQRHY